MSEAFSVWSRFSPGAIGPAQHAVGVQRKGGQKRIANLALTGLPWGVVEHLNPGSIKKHR